MGVGRPKKDQALERLAEVLAPVAEAALPPVEQVAPGGRHAMVNRLVESGQSERAVWLKLCAWPNTKIAVALGVSADVVDRYVKSAHFLALFEARKTEFLGRVLEAMEGRVLEVGMEALDVRLVLMRTAKSGWLRDKIAKDLVELAMEVAKGRGPAGDVAEKLIAAVERIRKRRMDDGSTETVKITVTGRAGEAAEALAEKAQAEFARADEPSGSGGGAGPDPGPGETR